MRSAYVSPDGPERLDYGRIPLEALHVLVVRVVRSGAPVAGAEVAVSTPDAGLGVGPPEVHRSDAEGIARFQGVLGPKVGVHAVAPDTGRAYREIRLPVEGVVDLELPDDRSATIHVRHGVTGAPVAGAEVHLAGGGTQPMPRGTGCLPPYPELRTLEDGSLAVSGLPQGYVWVVARAPGLAMRSEGMMVERVILKPDEADATVALFPYRAVRFPIAAVGVGAPPEGSLLAVHRYQPLTGYDVGEPRARVEDGQLVLEPFPPGFDRGHVVAENGTWAMWATAFDKDVGDTVEFRKIQDVRVQLRWRDGTPAVAQALWVLLRPRGSTGKVRTAVDGSAVFPRCVAETATVLWTPVEDGFGMPIGSVSLLTDPGPQTLAIDRPIEIVLRLLRAGAPGIPPGIEVRVPDLDPSRPTGGSRSLGREIQEEATTGELRFRWLPMPDGSAPPVTLRADGIPDVTVRPERGADGVWRADAELAKGATLRVRVTPPTGGRYWLQLTQWNEAQQRWWSLFDHPGHQAGRQAVDGVHVMPGLAPGRYRLLEGYSNFASAPIEIGSGGGDVDVAFDLGAVVEVRGRVVVPDGENPAYAWIVVKGRTEGQVSTMNPTSVKPDGTFEFRAVRGERLALVVRHPLLLPKEEGTSFLVGQDEVVLPLGPGPHVEFRIEGSNLTTAEPNPSTSPTWQSPVQVRAYGPGVPDSQGAVQPAIAKEGRLRAGVPGPGTWTLRIEQRGFVPIVLEDVKVGVGPTDLGTLRLSEGATLTVRLLPGESGVPREIAVQASLEGQRSYACWGGPLQPGDPPTVIVKGLGPGRFKVVVQRTGFRGAALAESTVESDGRSPISVDVKLR